MNDLFSQMQYLIWARVYQATSFDARSLHAISQLAEWKQQFDKNSTPIEFYAIHEHA